MIQQLAIVEVSLFSALVHQLNRYRLCFSQVFIGEVLNGSCKSAQCRSLLRDTDLHSEPGSALITLSEKWQTHMKDDAVSQDRLAQHRWSPLARLGALDEWTPVEKPPPEREKDLKGPTGPCYMGSDPILLKAPQCEGGAL